MSDYDSEKASRRTTSLWIRLGRAYEKAALAQIERGLYVNAFQCGKMADFAFWQATGENTSIQLSDIEGEKS